MRRAQLVRRILIGYCSTRLPGLTRIGCVRKYVYRATFIVFWDKWRDIQSFFSVCPTLYPPPPPPPTHTHPWYLPLSVRLSRLAASVCLSVFSLPLPFSCSLSLSLFMSVPLLFLFLFLCLSVPRSVCLPVYQPVCLSPPPLSPLSPLSSVTRLPPSLCPSLSNFSLCPSGPRPAPYPSHPFFQPFPRPFDQGNQNIRSNEHNVVYWPH